MGTSKGEQRCCRGTEQMKRVTQPNHLFFGRRHSIVGIPSESQPVGQYQAKHLVSKTCRRFLGGLAVAFLLQSASGAENVVPNNSFQIERGFKIEVAASDPMISAPVAMAFDENGRLFVVEQHRGQPRSANAGRVRMLENMNDEGVFQNSTIYADGLSWPSAVACYAGGVFVAAAPDLLYLKDTKADGMADARQVVLNGFGGTNTLDPRFLPNNFNWGPDNRVYGSSGGIGGDVAANGGGSRVNLAFADFSFDPKTLNVRADSGPSESGVCFDGHGRRFSTSYARPLMFPMYDLRYTERNPFYVKPAPLMMSADPWSPIFAYGVAPTSVNARAVSNLVTSVAMREAQGTAIYRGRAFPTNYFENAFIPDPQAHVIRRLVLHENGLDVNAQRPADEPTAEFLISKDPSFRPVQVINGPDGALYVADERDGNQGGRIYRIAPARLKRAKLAQMGKVKTYELVSTMAQGDGWHRDTASRLLYERNDPAAAALIRGTLAHSRLSQARIGALHALAGSGTLTDRDLDQALADTDPEVRQHAVLLAETTFKRGEASDLLWNHFKGLVQDPDIRVRYQLAFTLGELQGPPKPTLLSAILIRDLNNPWIQNAVLSSAASDAGDLFGNLAGSSLVLADPNGAFLLDRLATMIGTSGRLDAVNAVASLIKRKAVPAGVAYECLYALGKGLHRTRSSLTLVDRQGALQPLYTSALSVATDANQPEFSRVAATRVLGVGSLGIGMVGDWLVLVCNPPTSPLLQSAAVETLSRYDDPRLINALLQIWPVLGQAARDRALALFVSRDSQVGAVLDSIQAGSISVGALPVQLRDFLRTHPNPQVRARAVQLLGPGTIRRPDVVAKYKPALALRGIASHGEALFNQRCAECHVSRDPARPPFGPSLLRARNFGPDELLSSILEPSQEVRSDYATQVVESKEAQNLLGILLDENQTTVTLKQLGGEIIVWPVSNIRSVRTQNWSLMPAGLETGWSPQDLADVMEYIHTQRR